MSGTFFPGFFLSLILAIGAQKSKRPRGQAGPPWAAATRIDVA